MRFSSSGNESSFHSASVDLPIKIDSFRQKLFLFALIAVLYFVSGKLSLNLSTVDGSTTPIWPPSGIGLFAVLILGMEASAAVLIGCILLLLTSTSLPPFVILAVSLGNTLECLMASSLLNRSKHFNTKLSHPRDILTFFFFAVLLAPSVSATVAISSLYFSDILALAQVPSAWFTFFVGNGIGILAFTPLGLLHFLPREHQRYFFSNNLESIALLIVLFAVTSFAFTLKTPNAFMVIPFVAIVGLRLGTRGIAIGVLLVSAIALWSTLNERGPFSELPVNLGIVWSQAFIAVAFLTGYMVATLLESVINRDQRNSTLEVEAIAKKELEQVNAALESSRDRLRLVVETSPLAIAMFDREMRYMLTSRKWLSTFGIQAEDIAGKNHYEIFPEISDEWKAYHRRGLSGEFIQMKEDRFDRADGSSQWLRWEIRPWKGDDGEVGGILIFTEDITEERKSQALIAGQAEVFRMMASGDLLNNVLKEIVFTIESQGAGNVCAVFLLNQDDDTFTFGAGPRLPAEYIHNLEVFLKIPGLKICETSSSSGNRIFIEDISKEHESGAMRDIARRLELRSCLSEPILNYRGDVLGTFVIYLKGHKKPTSSELELIKKAAHLSGVAIERSRFLLSLEESEREFRSLAASMPQIVWAADTQGEVFFFNQRWSEYTGLDFEDSMKSKWQKLIHPVDFEKAQENWIEGIRSGSLPEMEFRIKSKDGNFRWFLGRGVAIRNSSGQIIKWFGTCTDIEEQKQIQNQLKQALRARDEFLSIASHELKTPLTSLKLQSQIFKRKLKKGEMEVFDTAFVAHTVDQTEKQVSRLTRLVNDMLDIARIRSGKLVIERERMDLCELVKESIQRMDAEFRSANYSLPVLELCDEKAFGSWDRLRLEQVINNLLTNAIRYGEGKSIKITVSEKDDHLLLAVKDHGRGIASDALEKVFDRFERAVDANEISGLGLGLFITKQIVTAHGGKIWVDSTLGKGSTFFVELPREKEPHNKVELVDVL